MRSWESTQWAKSSLPPVCVNSFFGTQARSSVYVLSVAGVMSGHGQKKLKCLLFGPLQKKLANPLQLD